MYKDNEYMYEEYYCYECFHTWILYCEDGITNNMRINWLNKIEEEHKKIHEKDND